MGRQDGTDTQCELPYTAATAYCQATGGTCAYAPGTVIGSWLLVCVCMGGHKAVQMSSSTPFDSQGAAKYMHDFIAERDHAMCSVQSSTIPVVQPIQL
jgi:hypothetical protein